MAIVRTVLPRHGIIEPQHGEAYETDVDTNWQTIDANLMSQSDVLALEVTVAAAPAAAGNFTLAHGLGRAPQHAIVMMTSSGAIWFQSPTLFDGTNLYLVASDAGVTAKVVVW